MKSSNLVSVLALVIGIISIPISCLYAWVGIVIGAVGMALAFYAKQKDDSKFPKAAMICSVIGVVMGLASIAVVVIFYLMATA